MKRTALMITLAIIGIFAASFCFGQAKGEPIKVGVILPLTGAEAKFGEIEKNSFEMARDEINQAGGINGRPIELLMEDDTGKPDVGRNAVEKLISRDKVIVLTGGYASQVTIVICQVAQQYKTPFLVTTGSADEITEKPWDYIFRIGPPVSEYTKGLVPFLKEVVKPETVAILYENTLFGQSGSKKFALICEEMGIKVLMREGYEAGAVDFKPLLTKVKAAKPDLVYMISYVMDAAQLINQSKELDLNPKLFVGGAAGFTLPEFLNNAKEAAEYVFSADLWNERLPYPGAKEYSEKYQKQFGTPTEYHGAEAYASLYVVADALKRAKEPTPKAVRDALAATDMKTAFGPVKFVSYGKKNQQNQLPTFLVQWQKGKLETVWPRDLASKPYVYPVPPWSAR